MTTQINGITQIQDGTVTAAKLSEEYLPRSGSVGMTGTLDGGGFRAANFHPPIMGTDLVTMDYIDTYVDSYVDDRITSLSFSIGEIGPKSITMAMLDTTNMPSSTTYLRGDGVWATVNSGGLPATADQFSTDIKDVISDIFGLFTGRSTLAELIGAVDQVIADLFGDAGSGGVILGIDVFWSGVAQALTNLVEGFVGLFTGSTSVAMLESDINAFVYSLTGTSGSPGLTAPAFDWTAVGADFENLVNGVVGMFLGTSTFSDVEAELDTLVKSLTGNDSSTSLANPQLNWPNLENDLETFALNLIEPFKGWPNLGTDIQNIIGDLTGRVISAPSITKPAPIHPSNVSGLTSGDTLSTDLQNIVNGVSNSFSGAVSGTETTVADIKTEIQGFLAHLFGTSSTPQTSTILTSVVTNLENAFGSLFNDTAGPSTTSQQLSPAIPIAPEHVYGITPISNVFETLGTDLQNLVSNAINGLAGNPITGDGSIVATVENLFTQTGVTKSSITGLSSSLQSLINKHHANNNSGYSFSVNFADYGNSSSPVNFNATTPLAVPFTLTTTGTGTGSYLAIQNSDAVWVEGSGDNQILAVYNGSPAQTKTDYQVFSATVANLPDVGAENIACLRMSTTGNDYVFGGVLRTGSFSATATLGYVVNGVPTVWTTVENVAPSYTFSLVAGTPGSSRTFQGYAGSNLVIEYTETGTSSMLGADYRGWGFYSATANNGTALPADAEFISCYDNAPPDLVGSGATITTGAPGSANVGLSYNWGQVVAIPAGFFDVVSEITADLSFNTTNSTLTTSFAGWYRIDIRLGGLSISDVGGMGTIAPAVSITTSGAESNVVGNPSLAWANFAGGFTRLPDVGGTLMAYLPADSVVIPCFYVETTGGELAPSITVNGSSNTYFSVALINRSTA